MVAFEPRVRLADRLGALRDKYFVGRDTELSRYAAALQKGEAPALFFVYGPGGVGKSVLLRQFARATTQHPPTVVSLDARDPEPSPAGCLSALRRALDPPDGESALQHLAARDKPVLLIDTYEQLVPLDAWM